MLPPGTRATRASHNSYILSLNILLIIRTSDTSMSQDGAEHSKKTTQPDFFNKRMYITKIKLNSTKQINTTQPNTTTSQRKKGRRKKSRDQ